MELKSISNIKIKCYKNTEMKYNLDYYLKYFKVI